MKGRRNPQGGQALVETVLLLPLLLILLGGGYWCFRDLSLSSSAESAAHAQMLRTGRRQAGIEPRLSGTIHPGDDVARIEAPQRSLIGEVPSSAAWQAERSHPRTYPSEKNPLARFLDLPSHTLRRGAEGAVDCWGRDTSSGMTVRRTVQGILFTGRSDEP